jgi:hypothetical protein
VGGFSLVNYRCTCQAGGTCQYAEGINAEKVFVLALDSLYPNSLVGSMDLEFWVHIFHHYCRPTAMRGN